MPTPTPELGLQKAVDADDTADYLDTSLANSLTTLDSLFNNVSGHTHGGVHQGGPINSIPASAIPDGSITSAKIQDGTITGLDMAPGSVGAAQIAAGAVGNTQLAANAVTTDKIADGTIQTADLAAGAVGNAQLAANAVTTDKIADGTIQSADLATGLTLSGPTINGGSISSATISGATITSPSGDAPISGTGATPLRVESGTSTSPSITSPGGAQISVSFARAFNSPPRVIAALAATGGQDVANKFGGSDNTTVTTSGFSWHAYYNGGGSGTVTVNWLAIGN